MLFLFVIGSIMMGVSCKKDTEFKATKTDGIIQKQGITTYQYGTHILVDNNGQTKYALKSESINLDNYINRYVEIKGHKIKGYPIDGGPDYIDVSEVK